MRKIFTTVMTVCLLALGASAQTVGWNDAAAAKQRTDAGRKASAATSTVMQATAQQTFKSRAMQHSETAFKSGRLRRQLLRLPQKAVTATDMPQNPLQLTYSATAFQYANQADVELRGDSIYLKNFFGWDSTVRAKVDLETGAFTIERQQVYMHPEYGRVDIMACDVEANVFDSAGTIPGQISDGSVTIGQWVAIIVDGDMKNYAIGYGLHKESQFRSSNATMTSTVINTDTAGVSTTATETMRLLVEQPATNKLLVYNLSDTGSQLDVYLNSDSTLSIAPQQLFSNSYGAFFCYPADWSQGVVYQARDIIGHVQGSTLQLGNWGIYTNTGKYYYRRYEKTDIEVPFTLAFPPHSASWAGSGTADDPYQIATAGDLFALAEAVNRVEIPSGEKLVKVFEGKYFKQTKAINLKGYMFTPIGGSDDMRRFAGTYDGDNKTISYLTVNTGSKGYAALFGAVDTVGTICNVSLSSPDISCGNYYYAGGVVAYSMGKTENCKVTNGKIRGYLIAGGVAGSSGPATNLTFTGSVEGASNVGGVIGNMRYPVSKCSATSATVVGYGGSESYSVGGVVGYMTATSLNVRTGGYIEDCYFSGTVTMNRSSMFAGGIAGCSTEADIRRCFAVGEINTTSTVSQTAAGGIVGAIQGMKIEDCFFAGNMEVAGQWTGPLAGYAINIQLAGHPANSEIKNCYIACHSRSTSDYAYTPYLGWFDTRTAGSAPTITNCRIDGSLLPRMSGREGFTPLAEMITATPWEGFNTEVWNFEQGYYPTLKTIAANSVANVAKAPMLFTGVDNTENVSTNFTAPAANSVKWQVLRNGTLGTDGHGIIITTASNVATMQLNGSVAVDTIYAVNGQIKKWFTVKLAPAGMFDGDGTADSPYLIKNKADLMRLSEATSVNQLTFDGSHFLITADIDLGMDADFKGINNCSSATYKFGGILDGGNHTLHGVRLVYPVLDEGGKIVSGKDTYRGFIGRLKQGGVVKNLRMGADCVFEFYSSSGAFVGENNGGDIINCRNYATVKAHAGTSGAICGYARAGSRIINCYNAGDVIGGYHYVGGIASYNYGVIEGCQNDGRVATELINTTYSNSQLAGAGGIVLANFGQIYNSLNTGSVYSMKYAGGIEGWHNTADKQTSMRGCLNLGNVTCGDAATIGQLTGHQYKVPVMENNYYDSQISTVLAGDGAAMAGANPSTTAFLTSGDTIAGMAGSEWDFVAGRYPALRAFADEPKARAASMTVADMGASVNHRNIRSDITLATAAGLTWKVKEGSKVFSVNGAVLEMYACDEHTDTLTGTMDGYERRIVLTTTPDTLATPTVDHALQPDNYTYKVMFGHAVEGVTYIYTVDGSAPAPDNENASTTDGEAMIKVRTADITVRAAAYHRNYYLSPEITHQLLYTGVEGVEADLPVLRTIYVNANGLSSSQPWTGVNLIITVYADGTRTCRKVNLK